MYRSRDVGSFRFLRALCGASRKAGDDECASHGGLSVAEDGTLECIGAASFGGEPSRASLSTTGDDSESELSTVSIVAWPNTIPATRIRWRPFAAVMGARMQ